MSVRKRIRRIVSSSSLAGVGALIGLSISNGEYVGLKLFVSFCLILSSLEIILWEVNKKLSFGRLEMEALLCIYLMLASGLVGMSIIQGGHIWFKFLLCVLLAALSLGIVLYESRDFWRGR